MDESLQQLKKDLIEMMNLDFKVEDIGDDDAIFGAGLGLDSIDALELIVYLEKKHKIKLDNPREAKRIFSSIRILGEYIKANAK